MKNWKQQSELKQILKERKRENHYINFGWVMLGVLIALAIFVYGGNLLYWVFNY